MADVHSFIARWSGGQGGQERANYALFLTELCDVLGLEHPRPAGDAAGNDYVFERAVTFRAPDGATALGRIDLYKRGSFVLEAKQSRQKGQSKEVALAAPLEERRRTRSERHWDVLMMNARIQAEAYAKALPPDHGWPPFIIVCDVGHCFEIYADFSGQGKNYAQFPDRQGFRVFLEDLARADIRERLQAVWSDPLSLDPARRSARVTRRIAERLAQVSKRLEERGLPPEEVALFLMRALFTMFAEDVGLLPQDSFRRLLERCAAEPGKFVPMVQQLWQAMDQGYQFAFGIEEVVRRFNGNLFRQARALPLDAAEIAELRMAAQADWREVDPSIFGALLEQALDARERARLGAHYTPRAYVERLVVSTVIEPLRADWASVLGAAERKKQEGDGAAARALIAAFHDRLIRTRVLDPACGTGNFLYVALELMKRLEGEVLESLLDLGGEEALKGLERHEVDPHQFLGLEINERARHIAELVLWIGHLQWQLRNLGALPGDPVLRDYRNIERRDAVLAHDGIAVKDGREVLLNPRRPQWPEAEFIVGNPPFIGKGAMMRDALGDAYVEALWKAHPQVNESADFVMYWWNHAAELLGHNESSLRRFGLVTTNSITQVFNRRVVERHLTAKPPVSLRMAIPDHPWTKTTASSAAVRIAMTVCELGDSDGLLREVIAEHALDTDEPVVEFEDSVGRIHADLTIGANLTGAAKLLANEGLSCNGMMLAGRGFVLSPSEAEALSARDGPAAAKIIRPFINGGDLVRRPQPKAVIDALEYTPEQLRRDAPHIYQHLLQAVKPERDLNRRIAFRKRWWAFGEPRKTFRPALFDLQRYIGTTETSKHRIFQFLPSSVVPDHMIIAIALDDAFHLGVLSSRIHVVWALRAGGWLGVGNDPRYSKSRCFDPFPFPEGDAATCAEIARLAEEIDGLRKQRQSETGVTLTQIYNVLEALRRGAALDAREEEIKRQGLVLILRELHDRLDRAVARAYGWPADLAEEEILARLVALNGARAGEEAKGRVRWLRPAYQIPRFATRRAGDQLEAALASPALASAAAKPPLPADDVAQTAAVMAALAAARESLTAEAIALHFRQGRRAAPRIRATLESLARLGFLATPDDGRSFSLLSLSPMGLSDSHAPSSSAVIPRRAAGGTGGPRIPETSP